MLGMANEHELLAEAEQLVADYTRHVAKQEAQIAEFSTRGPPPADAVDVLKQLREMLRIAKWNRDFIRRKLRGATD